MKSLIFALFTICSLSASAQNPNTTLEADTSKFTFVSTEPIPLNLPEVSQQIKYPLGARLQDIEGKVVMRVLVDEQGNYVRHIVIEEAHPLLAAAVKRKIHLLKFEPAMQGSKPIKFWVNMPFNFNLTEEK